MTSPPKAAAPGVAETAAALADLSAELYDLTSGPQSRNRAAAEDAVEVVETVFLALRTAHPQAPLHVMAMGYGLSDMRSALGLPPRAEVEAAAGEESGHVARP
ncbi:hypothetical protein ACFU3J_16210 [Streptomyces sp. NPDC057411]|uniref:hypothetical protein n=1 Tax=unclassified Streptomyces TaxID=2593676 RepID=UPI0036299245